jgi:hypothetical protein
LQAGIEEGGAVLTREGLLQDRIARIDQNLLQGGAAGYRTCHPAILATKVDGWQQLSRGVSNRAAVRAALNKFEVAGLIKVDRRRGKSPLVTLLHL